MWSELLQTEEKKYPVLEDAVNLFNQGLTPSEKLTREESIAKGYFVEETDRTRLIQLGSQLIEVDFRKTVSADGRRIVWFKGHAPHVRKKFLEARDEHNKFQNQVQTRRRGRKSIGSVLKKFMDAPITKREFGALPKTVQSSLEEFLGGEVTRGDVAAFALMGRAMEGDIVAFKEIADRVEGKAVQRTENKNLNVNYTDFLSGLGGFDSESEEEEI